jgi:hypothetical protein
MKRLSSEPPTWFSATSPANDSQPLHYSTMPSPFLRVFKGFQRFSGTNLTPPPLPQCIKHPADKCYGSRILLRLILRLVFKKASVKWGLLRCYGSRPQRPTPTRCRVAVPGEGSPANLQLSTFDFQPRCSKPFYVNLPKPNGHQ